MRSPDLVTWEQAEESPGTGAGLRLPALTSDLSPQNFCRVTVPMD